MRLASHLASLSLALGGLLGGCSKEPPPGPPARPPVVAPHEPRLALEYRPGDATTDRRIARTQAAVRTQPSSHAPYGELGILLLRRMRETSDSSLAPFAEDAIRAARSRAPGDAGVLALSTMLALDAHRFAEAADMARRVIGAAPSDPTGHLLLGDALLEVGRHEEAVLAYQRALDLRPDLRSHNRAAHVRWLEGDVEGAIELLGLALDAGSASDPESSAWCLVDLGNIYWHAGRPLEALRSAERARAVLPGYLPALQLEARARFALGRRAEAVAILEGVVARRPLVEDLLLLSEWLAALGRVEPARVRRDEAVRRGDEDPRAMALHYARHDIEHEEALRLARREIRLREGLYSRDVHALALARAGGSEDASFEIGRALALGTPDARLLLHDAIVRLSRGDRDGAREALGRARAMNPHADERLVAEISRRLDVAAPLTVGVR